MTSDIFGARLSKLVMTSEKSMTKLSEELGIKRNTLWHLMKGIREPRVSTLIKIAKYFGVTTDYMLGMSEVPSAEPVHIKARWLPIGMADAVGGESAMWGDKIAYHVCDKCWEQAPERDGEEFLSDFCPNCGARMEVDNER